MSLRAGADDICDNRIQPVVGGGRSNPSICCTKTSNLAASALSLHQANCPGYFYNYYHLGIDILFDGARHTVKKIICHSNFPGHADFGTYQRCHFRLLAKATERLSEKNHSVNALESEAGKGDEERKKMMNKLPTKKQGNGNRSSFKKHHQATRGTTMTASTYSKVSSLSSNSKSNSKTNSTVIASLRSSWKRARPVIERFVGTPSGPMVCAGNSGVDDVYSFAGQAVSPCPYAPSLLYAVPGCIFEVLEGSGHIATLTVFSE